jgi:hypothetical protein
MGKSSLKASQRGRVRPPTPPQAPILRMRETGEAVRWKDRTGTYRRDVGDGEHSEIVIGARVYRVRTSDLG